jgi:hypothetical protein
MIGNNGDIVDALLAQHEQAKSLLAGVKAASGTEKQTLFQELTAMLKMHETGEQQVVHPALATLGADGDEVAQARLAEEQEADDAIAELTRLGTDHADFDAKFEEFRQAVLEHATREENEEFPRLRKGLTAEKLHAMADEFYTAQH